ncbi:MAG: PilN domain-containing protein [Deltaproteobacteria bacterium]|jgi:Tfp pilus assembly protein PilN|nr:PilN domain-containing protein [Deltaproteobacteria bacterium]
MIKINLLPLESFRQTASGQLSVTIFAVCMLMLVGGLYMFNLMFMAPAKETLTATKTSQTQKLSQMKNSAAAAMVQTRDFVTQMVQVSTIANLEERRRDQARLFMALAGQINNQTSWLQSVSHNGRTLLIRGMAIDNETVGMLLDRLQQMPLLQNVVLGQAAGGTVINNVRLVNFDIKADTVFPDPSLMDQGLSDIKLPDTTTIKGLIQAIDPELSKALDRNAEVARLL